MLVATLMALASGAARAATDKPVWFWFQTCGSESMGVEVTLDGERVFRTTFPVCAKPRADQSRGGQRVLEFAFTPNREIAWVGYLEEDNVSPAGLALEGNIWQAGAEEDALILGLTFDSGDKIYMNTLHLAHIRQTDQSEVEPGLVVRTFPIAADAKEESR